MRLILITAAIAISSFGNPTHATVKSELTQKIESISLDSGIIEPTDRDHDDFVSVSFSLDDQGRIVLHEMNYSNETLKNQLVNKLKEIKISGNDDPNEVYNYKFSFKFI